MQFVRFFYNLFYTKTAHSNYLLNATEVIHFKIKSWPICPLRLNSFLFISKHWKCGDVGLQISWKCFYFIFYLFAFLPFLASLIEISCIFDGFCKKMLIYLLTFGKRYTFWLLRYQVDYQFTLFSFSSKRIFSYISGTFNEMLWVLALPKCINGVSWSWSLNGV